MLPGRQLGESPGKGNVESGRLLCTRWTLQLAWAFSDSKFLFFPVCLWGFLVWFGFCFFCLFFVLVCVFILFWFWGFASVLGVFLLVFYFLYY